MGLDSCSSPWVVIFFSIGKMIFLLKRFWVLVGVLFCDGGLVPVFQ